MQQARARHQGAARPRPSAAGRRDSARTSWPRRSRRIGKSAKTRSSARRLRRAGAGGEGAELEVLLARVMPPKSRRPSGHQGQAALDDLVRRRARARSWPSQRMVPARGRSRPATRPQQRALARAVGAEQRDDLAGAHRERDAPERAHVAVGRRRGRATSSTRGRLHVAAQVGVDHGGIGGDRRGRALGDLLARAQHDDAAARGPSAPRRCARP